jgi:hypothetical protein
MKQPGAHGGFRDPDDFRHFARAPLFDFAQHERDPVIDRQLVERAREQLSELTAPRVVLGVALRLKRLAPQALERFAPARRGAHVVPGVVHGDADEKRAKRRIAAIPRDRFGQRDEHVVHEILARARIADETLGESPHRGVMPIVHLPDSARVAARESRDERFPVVGGVR